MEKPEHPEDGQSCGVCVKVIQDNVPSISCWKQSGDSFYVLLLSSACCEVQVPRRWLRASEGNNKGFQSVLGKLEEMLDFK